MEVDFRNKIFCLHPKNLDSVIGFASDLLCNLGQVCKLNREDWWMAWAYRLGKSGSSWPDQGICFKPFESARPESGIGFWNSQGESILAPKPFPEGETALTVLGRMQHSAPAVGLTKELSCPMHSYRCIITATRVMGFLCWGGEGFFGN